MNAELIRPQSLTRSIAVAVLVVPASMIPELTLAALPPVVPDAGRLTRELQPPVAPTAPRTDLVLPAPSAETVDAGGAQVTLQGVVFSGNTQFTQDDLLKLVQTDIGRRHDLAGIYQMADKVTTFYRTLGYPFAKVFVPENGLRGGMLTLQVVEGRYGDIIVRGEGLESRRARQAQRFMAPLRPGDVIRQRSLERQVLLLGDQPGYRAVPVIKPGRAVGTGDLDIEMTRTPRVTGDVGVSNHGNRYTGYHQLRAGVQLNSPLRVGDQLSLGLIASDDRLRSSSLSYSTPLGSHGLRATAGYSLTEYRLGREFANLQASGRSQVSSLGLSYPVLRSLQSNITVSGQGQHKRFFDEQQVVSARQSRGSDVGVLRVNADRRDGRGISYGQLEWAVGTFDDNQPDLAGTQGRFQRVNLEAVRLQQLSHRISLSARVSAQKAFDNLDSSESFSLGGPYAVRAYPVGEGTGDEGVISQLELRYQTAPGLAPFLFFDAGRATLEHKATAPGKNSRSLSGSGVGVRYQTPTWNHELVLARRLLGDEPESDPRDGLWTGWFSFGYAF